MSFFLFLLVSKFMKESAAPPTAPTADPNAKLHLRGLRALPPQSVPHQRPQEQPQIKAAREPKQLTIDNWMVGHSERAKYFATQDWSAPYHREQTTAELLEAGEISQLQIRQDDDVLFTGMEAALHLDGPQFVDNAAISNDIHNAMPAADMGEEVMHADMGSDTQLSFAIFLTF